MREIAAAGDLTLVYMWNEMRHVQVESVEAGDAPAVATHLTGLCLLLCPESPSR